MIEAILIFPVVTTLILLFVKSKKLNNFVVISYAFFHLACSISFYLNGTGFEKPVKNLF
jgi:hypothetical protein